MYGISVKTHFSGAHHLRGYDGACSKLHGHNWEVEVFLSGPKTNKTGMLADFNEVKSAVGRVLDNLDHEDLNSLQMFADANPTSENVAKYLYHELSAVLNGPQYTVCRVWISETPGTAASYWEDT